MELNQKNVDTLNEKGHNVVGRDFFHFKTEKKYDYVIGAPNFKDNIDVEHIRKMMNHVKCGGSLISLTSPYWLTGNSDRQVTFRKWLDGYQYSLEILPDNTFMEDGITVPTCIISILNY